MSVLRELVLTECEPELVCVEGLAWPLTWGVLGDTSDAVISGPNSLPSSQPELNGSVPQVEEVEVRVLP